MERNLTIFVKDESLNVKFDDEDILPEDLLVEILSRLPVRDLVCLRCVCKSWCALIDDINFIKRHYQFQYAIRKADGDIPFICSGPSFDFFDIKLKVCLLSQQLGDVPLDLTPDLVRDTAPSFASAPPHLIDDIEFVGVVKGLVCFIWGNNDLGLWNPATREFKAITPWLYNRIPSSHRNLIGFGFDCISNDFKIVRGNCSDDKILGYEVYSLATNSWKSLREPSTLVKLFRRRTLTEAYLNGVCYWPVYSDLSDTRLILSFNFSTEVFMVFNKPHNTIGSEIKFETDWEITVYKECLADVVKRTDLEKAECKFDIWVVTEFHSDSGVPRSWQHLFTMGPFPSSYGLYFHRFRMDGDVLFRNRVPSLEQECIVYNWSTGEFEVFEFNIEMIFDYVESLFPLKKKYKNTVKKSSSSSSQGLFFTNPSDAKCFELSKENWGSLPVVKEEKDFRQLYPHLINSFEAHDFPKAMVMTYLSNVDSAVLEEWNTDWKKVHIAETEAYLLKLALIQKQTIWISNQMKSSD